MADFPVPEIEETAPTIERLLVYPYPDLTKLWVRIDLSPFAKYPNVEVTLFAPEGQRLSGFNIIENRDFNISATLHLRSEPREGETYRLEVTVSRDDEILARESKSFEMVFVEPGPEAARPKPPGPGPLYI